jgi:hypothetical protein
MVNGLGIGSGHKLIEFTGAHRRSAQMVVAGLPRKTQISIVIDKLRGRGSR